MSIMEFLCIFFIFIKSSIIDVWQDRKYYQSFQITDSSDLVFFAWVRIFNYLLMNIPRVPLRIIIIQKNATIQLLPLLCFFSKSNPVGRGTSIMEKYLMTEFVVHADTKWKSTADHSTNTKTLTLECHTYLNKGLVKYLWPFSGHQASKA